MSNSPETAQLPPTNSTTTTPPLSPSSPRSPNGSASDQQLTKDSPANTSSTTFTPATPSATAPSSKRAFASIFRLTNSNKAEQKRMDKEDEHRERSASLTQQKQQQQQEQGKERPQSANPQPQEQELLQQEVLLQQTQPQQSQQLQPQELHMQQIQSDTKATDKPESPKVVADNSKPLPAKSTLAQTSPHLTRKATRRSGNRYTATSTVDRREQLPNLYRLLAENKLTELEIWEGDAGLFPVLYQYREIFEKMEPVVSVVTFALPASEFGGVNAQKTYKINNDLTVAQAIHLICKKIGVSNPDRFCLCTFRKFYLNHDQPLYIYGLGTLFERWELKLMFQSEVFSSTIGPTPQQLTDSTVVFHLPPLQEFGGLNKKVTRVDPRARTHDIVEQFCTKHKIANSQQFVVMTHALDNARRFVLSDQATFSDYGLGGRFQKWEVNLVFDDLVPDFVMRHLGIPKYGWAQVDQLNFTPSEYKDMICDLENTIFVNTQKANDEIANLRADLYATQQKLSETTTALGNSKAHGQSLVQKIDELLLQISKTESELSDTQEQLSNSRSAFATVSEELADTKVRLTTTQEELRAHTATIRENARQLEQTKRTVEMRDDEIAQLKSRLEATLAELLESQTHYKSTSQKLEDTTQELNATTQAHDTVSAELEQMKFVYEESMRQRKDLNSELAQMKEVLTGKLTAGSERILDMESQLREADARYFESEAKFKREIETARKEYLAEKRQAESNKQQEITDITRFHEAKQHFAIKELTTNYEAKLDESDTKLKTLTRDYDELRVQREGLFDQIDEWRQRAVEWEETKKSITSGRQEAEKKLQTTQATLDTTKKAKAEDERTLTRTLLALESTTAELSSEKDKYKALEDQLKVYVAAVKAEQAAKQVTTAALLDITESKVPLPPVAPPTPPPAPAAGTSRPVSMQVNGGSSGSFGSFIAVKKDGLRPVGQPTLGGKRAEGGGHTIADLLFASMQKRFTSISGNDDDVEELDELEEDDESNGTFD